MCPIPPRGIPGGPRFHDSPVLHAPLPPLTRTPLALSPPLQPTSWPPATPCPPSHAALRTSVDRSLLPLYQPEFLWVRARPPRVPPSRGCSPADAPRGTPRDVNRCRGRRSRSAHRGRPEPFHSSAFPVGARTATRPPPSELMRTSVAPRRSETGPTPRSTSTSPRTRRASAKPRRIGSGSASHSRWPSSSSLEVLWARSPRNRRTISFAQALRRQSGIIGTPRSRTGVSSSPGGNSLHPPRRRVPGSPVRRTPPSAW